MIEFTDEELSEIYFVLCDEAYYGDDEIVYTSAGNLLRQALRKVEDEAKARRLW
jgi:hypothetical protein